MLCACGVCGLEVKEGKKYIHNHHRIGKTKENDESVRRQAEKMSKYMKNGGSIHSISFITEEGRRRQAKKLKGRTKETHEYIRNRIEKVIGRTAETHEYIRIIAKKKTGRTKENDEGIKRQAEKLVEKWKDPEFQRKQKEARDLKPNKCEIKILNILDKVYPNEWKYTGDFSFWISGKNPDFTCINGKKLLIEHFGTYWHRDDNPEEYKKIYSEFGYKTLVIWENELKNMKKVENKIKKFIEEKIK